MVFGFPGYSAEWGRREHSVPLAIVPKEYAKFSRSRIGFGKVSQGGTGNDSAGSKRFTKEQSTSVSQGGIGIVAATPPVNEQVRSRTESSQSAGILPNTAWESPW